MKLHITEHLEHALPSSQGEHFPSFWSPFVLPNFPFGQGISSPVPSVQYIPKEHLEPPFALSTGFVPSQKNPALHLLLLFTTDRPVPEDVDCGFFLHEIDCVEKIINKTV